mgnify:FL=1
MYKSTPNPSLTIVHIGAGKCRELSSYLSQNPDRVVLVEANPALLPGLQHLARYHQNLQVLPVAVTPEGGKTDFHLLTNALESSVLAPEALLEVYPNLKTAEIRSLEAITPAELFSQL